MSLTRYLPCGVVLAAGILALKRMRRVGYLGELSRSLGDPGHFNPKMD